jgi:DNA-binding PadR family transcriptional regulator
VPKTKIQSKFDKLGIDIDSSQMKILKAVMAASGRPAKSVSYKEITEKLQELENKKSSYTKAYIYRHLSNLEQEGYLVIDAVQKPRKYAISESGMLGLLRKKKELALSNLHTEKQELLNKLNILTSANPESVAFVAFNQLMGLESIASSIIIEGIENVRNSVIREFGRVAKPGDKIRVIAPASVLDGGLDHAGMAEVSLLTRAADDVKVWGLLVPTRDLSFTAKLMAKFMDNISDMFARFASSGNIVLKIAKENLKTYRMVSLNREKMLLYLTHAADSDIAALIHRKDNPGLIDDAVDTFDKLSAEGIDIIELIPTTN